MWPFTRRNPARELAQIGAEKRRRAALTHRGHVRAVAIEMAAKLGMAEHIEILKGVNHD